MSFATLIVGYTGRFKAGCIAFQCRP